MARLIDVTGKALSGEWGCDDLTGDGIPVLRTTNFTNDGIVNYASVAIRDIKKKGLDVKYLRPGDIIIEKSGGSDNQPVGRVIYYDGPESTYLFNNFTGLLRVMDASMWLPRYIFYTLFANYLKGGTRSYENRTTGLHNLQISAYVSSVEIRERSIYEQKLICTTLDKVNYLISLRKKQLVKLDDLVKSRFIEMFGDMENNPRNLPVYSWEAVFSTTTGKLDSNAMVEGGQYPFFTCAKESYWIDTYAFDCAALLLAGNNAAGVYDVKYYKGKFNAYQRTYVLQLLNQSWSYSLFKRQLEDKLTYLQSQSKGTNTRYLTLGILNDLKFIIPPIEEQQQIAIFCQQVDKSKFEIQKSLEKLETLKKALMQKYFEM